MDLTWQDEERWCAWRHAEALFGRFFNYREMCLPCILPSSHLTNLR